MTTKHKYKSAAYLLKTMGNVNRLQIVVLLRQKEMTVSELNRFIKVSQPRLSQCLNELRRVNVVNARRDGRQMIYGIADVTTPVIAIVDGIVRTLELE